MVVSYSHSSSPSAPVPALPLERILSDDGSRNSGSIPLNEITIRQWDLNENSTHYDRMIAAPSDEDLVRFWSGWAGIMLCTAVLTTIILVPLVFSRTKVRENPFHLYLIFLMAPDMLVAWTCGFTCLSNALAGQFTTEFMCYFQSFYMIASICANSWLNAVVAWQLYTMLRSAHHFRRYQPPTHRQVAFHAGCVYLYSLFLAGWGMFDTKWWPHKTRLTIGAACIPMDYDTASTVFFYCVFFPLLFGGPLAYVCWAAYRIWKHKMLPPTGKRRLLSIYFFRLAAVFVIMWLPGLLLLFVTSAWLDPWIQWAGGSWSHLQGAVSALVSLLKPEIWTTVRDFWLCSSTEGGESNQPDDSSIRSNNSSRAWLSAVFKRGSFMHSMHSIRDNLKGEKYGRSLNTAGNSDLQGSSAFDLNSQHMMEPTGYQDDKCDIQGGDQGGDQAVRSFIIEDLVSKSARARKLNPDSFHDLESSSGSRSCSSDDEFADEGEFEGDRVEQTTTDEEVGLICHDNVVAGSTLEPLDVSTSSDDHQYATVQDDEKDIFVDDPAPHDKDVALKVSEDLVALEGERDNDNHRQVVTVSEPDCPPGPSGTEDSERGSFIDDH